MPHPLVLQLRFTRHEFIRGLEGLRDEDARKRILPMNCISWNVGHLAWQEQRYWLYRGQEKILLPEVNTTYAYGAPGSTPPLADSLAAWQAITQAADPWLDELTSEKPTQFYVAKGRTGPNTFGSLLLRTIYHYWYHTGENMGIRQALGHTNLPEYVGNIDDEAPYLPEA